MKKFNKNRGLALLVILLLAVIVATVMVMPSQTPLPRFVAHAAGATPDGTIHTNTLQALDYTYKAGHRLFEIDFSWSADGHLVAMHDWAQAFSRLYNAVSGKTAIPSRQQFENMKTIYGDDPLSFVELDIWLKSHKSARIVTDIKQDNLRGLAYIRRHTTEQRRYIPQIYTSKEYRPTSEMGYEDIIFTLYRTKETNQEVLLFTRDHRLLALTMWPDRATNGLFARQVEALGIPVFVHTVNNCGQYSALRIKGVYGVYTDLLNGGADSQDCSMYVKKKKG